MVRLLSKQELAEPFTAKCEEDGDTVFIFHLDTETKEATLFAGEGDKRTAILAAALILEHYGVKLKEVESAD